MRRQNGNANKLLLILHIMVIITGIVCDKNAEIVESKYTKDDQGNYEFWVEQSDGIYVWQTGRLMYTKDNKSYIHISGGYLYTDLINNVRRIVTFVADENGFRPIISEVVLEVPSTPDRIPLRLASGAAGG